MCGITGHYHFNSDAKIDESQLKNSLQTLRKRGPDSQNVQILPGIGLGHTRLSIIDLNASANQPMKDPTGRYTLVFNGEIFNYKELRQELGVETRSDTEVLLSAYSRWKEKCLEKLNGFFSFVIYDHSEHSLFAARDRFGIKPFLYSLNNRSLYFASELKALMEYPIPRNLSDSANNAFFQLSYIPGAQGIFQDVKRLLPGYYLKVKNGELNLHSYHLIAPSRPSSIKFNEAKEHLKVLVEESVDIWTESDAPLGAFLSGGIDSSIVVAITSQKIPHLKTFSVAFPDSDFHNESPFALSVARKFQTEHTEIPVTTENLYACVDQVLEYLDEPFADSSAIPTFALSQQVGKHIRVALSGDGADEVFGGYEKYTAEALVQNWQSFLKPTRLLLPLIQHLPQSRDSKWTNKIRKANRFLKGLSLDESDRYLQWCSFVAPKTVQALISESHYNQNWKNDLPFPEQDSFRGLNRTLYRDSRMVLPNDMLTKVDLMSMANSLEVRPLLLDHRIVDFVFSLPDSFKVHGHQKKKLLLEAFKSLLPHEVYSRPKHGFTVELMPFFRNHFWQKLNDVYLNDTFVRDQGIFNPGAIQKVKQQIKDEKATDIQALVWALITFQNFWLKFKVGNNTQ